MNVSQLVAQRQARRRRQRMRRLNVMQEQIVFLGLIALGAFSYFYVQVLVPTPPVLKKVAVFWTITLGVFGFKSQAEPPVEVEDIYYLAPQSAQLSQYFWRWWGDAFLKNGVLASLVGLVDYVVGALLAGYSSEQTLIFIINYLLYAQLLEALRFLSCLEGRDLRVVRVVARLFGIPFLYAAQVPNISRGVLVAVSFVFFYTAFKLYHLKRHPQPVNLSRLVHLKDETLGYRMSQLFAREVAGRRSVQSGATVAAPQRRFLKSPTALYLFTQLTRSTARLKSLIALLVSLAFWVYAFSELKPGGIAAVVLSTYLVNRQVAGWVEHMPGASFHLMYPESSDQIQKAKKNTRRVVSGGSFVFFLVIYWFSA